MPKPHGTYLRVKRQEKIRHKASYDKANLSVKSKSEAVRNMDAMQRKMAVLQDWINNGALSSKSKEDEIREDVSEGIELLAKYMEKYQEYDKLERELREPAYPILHAKPSLASHGDLLALAIALCKVFSVLIKTVGRK